MVLFLLLNILTLRATLCLFRTFGRTDNINEKNNQNFFWNVSKMGKPKFNPIQKEF
jgi:hypothetical protein